MLKVFYACDMGMAGHAYPDGRAVLDQPVLLLEAFNTIAAARARAGKKEKG